MNTLTILQNLINSIFTTNGTKGITGLTTRTTLNTLLSSTYLPAGSTMDWFGPDATIPDGWHKMDGTFYPIPTDENSTYYDLFNALGGYQSPYLIFQPSPTTFPLPNVPEGFNTIQCGADYVLGSTGGEFKHTLSRPELPDVEIGSGINIGVNGVPIAQNGTNPSAGLELATEALGSGAAHNNMPPYMCVNKIIKLY